MYFLPYFRGVLLGVDSLQGGLAKGNRISPGENFAGKILPLRKVAKFSRGETLVQQFIIVFSKKSQALTNAPEPTASCADV